jgi:rare lipoprotein A
MPLSGAVRRWRSALLVLCISVLAACGSVQRQPASIDDGARTASITKTPSPAPALPPAGSGRGGYYQDDGPGDRTPDGLLAVPDAEPKVEPYSSRGNKPYVVFGKTYVPLTDNQPYKRRGVGSWYGKKFHGQKTSSGEIYDMYKMTAAHATLPIPSYARVTNLSNGKQVIVRINDRGPFVANRIIDLSYTAALKLGYLNQGSTQLEVERLLPEDIARINAEKRQAAASREQVQSPTQSSQSSIAQPVVVVPIVEARPAVAAPAQPAVNEQANAKPDGIAQAVSMSSIAISADKPVAVAPAAVPTVAASPGGFYLQLGAFSQAANAEAMRSQLEQKWTGVLMPIEVVSNNGLYRLYSGPFTGRAEAAEAAQKLQDSGATKPLIVQK